MNLFVTDETFCYDIQLIIDGYYNIIVINYIVYLIS